MFIRSMDWDYQVLSILQKNEYHICYLCRRLSATVEQETTCYLHAFFMDRVDERMKSFLMDLAAKREPVDLAEAFLTGETLYLEWSSTEKESPTEKEPSSGTEVGTSAATAERSIAERIAIAKNLLETCLAKRLPTGILREVLADENLQLQDGQFEFRYLFREAEKLAENRLPEVCSQLSCLCRKIFGKSLKSEAGTAMAEWCRWLETPSDEIQKLADVYPAFLDAIEVMENADEEQLAVTSEWKKKTQKLTATIQHILSPVPLAEGDYVVIGNYHVFTKFLLLAGAAAAVILFKFVTGSGV